MAQNEGKVPCRSGHSDCTADCGCCKGTGFMREKNFEAPIISAGGQDYVSAGLSPIVVDAEAILKPKISGTRLSNRLIVAAPDEADQEG